MPDNFPAGKEIGTFNDVTLGKGSSPGQQSGVRKKIKAIMFVPEGHKVDDADLDVQVVSIDQTTFDAMGPRRC